MAPYEQTSVTFESSDILFQETNVGNKMAFILSPSQYVNNMA